jgi:capsular exopolysaccharide synthesis family protein
MSTVTPSRPAPPRPGPSRPRGPLAGGRTTGIDPFRVLRRHLLAIIVAGFIGAVLGVVAQFMFLNFYKLYSGQARFMIQPGITEVGDVGTREMLKDEDVLRLGKTELMLMLSRDVLKDAVRTPDVQQKTDWFKINYMQEGRPLVEEAVDELEDALSTGVIRGTELFEVGWSTHEKHDVPIVLNAVADAYLAMRERLDNEVYNTNLEAFRAQLAGTNMQIDDLDEEIKTFIRQKGIQSLMDTRFHQSALALQGLVGQITAAESQRNLSYTSYLQTAAKLEGTLEYSQEDILEAEMDYAVAQHVRNVEAIRVEMRVLADKYQPDHPAIKRMGDRLRAAEAEKMEKRNEVIRRNLNARLKAYAYEMERMTRVIDELETEMEAQDATLRELAAEQSEFQSMNTRRTHLEDARDDDIELIKSVQMMRVRKDAQRVRLAQRAQIPRELSFPRPHIVVPLSILFVLAVTISFIFLREITDQRVKSASDLEVLPGARVLGVVPDLSEDPTKSEAAELVVRRFPNSVLAESYRQISAPLAKAIDRAGHQTIVLLGGLPGAGTTTAASNLAAGYAASGRNVVLVDANFRRPRLAQIMGVSGDQPGLGDVLAGDASLEEALVETEYGVNVLSAGTPASRVIERLNTDAFRSLVAELRGRFGLIIFDAPPAVVAGDAMALANRLDAAVLIVRANQEHRGLVARLVRQLEDAQCDLLGIILNRPRGTAGGYFKKNFAAMAAYASKRGS